MLVSLHTQHPFDNECVFLSLDTIKHQNVKTNFFEHASLRREIFERLKTTLM